MPFKSEKQRRYLWANEPEIARDWSDKYGSRVKKAKGGRIPFQYGSSTFSPGIEQILAQNNNFGWDQNVYKQNMLDQYTGIMSKYLPEGTANITSSPVFNRGFKEWNPSGFGSLLTRMALPTMSGTRGLAGSFPGSTGMTVDPLEQFIERAGGNVRQGELDWAETFGHEGTHLGWQYEPKKIGSIFGKDINIPGEFGALSRFGKGGEEKWNYLHDLMYGSGPIMKEQEKRYNEYMEMASKVKGPPSIRPSQDEINRIRGRYDEMPKGSATSLSHLTGETDPGETEVTGKLVNPGDLSLTPQAWYDIQNSGLIPEHKKVLGVGVNPFEDTMMGRTMTYPDNNLDNLYAGSTGNISGVKWKDDKQPFTFSKYQGPSQEEEGWDYRTPKKMGMLEKLRNRFYRPAAGAINYGGKTYTPAQLNQMNALGGYYSEPARQQRQKEAAQINILNRAAENKAVGNVNKLLGQYGYSGTLGSGTLQFTGIPEGDPTAGAGYSRSDDSWSASPFRKGGLATLWPK